MPNIYETKYGASFNGKHSFRDYGMYPHKAFSLTPPKPTTLYVSVPGADGSLDLTEALGGPVRYEDRKGSLEFVLFGDRSARRSAIDALICDVHGRRVTLSTDESPDACLHGRVQVTSEKTDAAKTVLKLEGVFDPYRTEPTSTDENWLWDPFSFERGVVREYADLIVDGALDLELIGSPMPVTPVFRVTSGTGLTMALGGNTYTLLPGENVFAAVVLTDAAYNVRFTGTGTVTVAFAAGRL